MADHVIIIENKIDAVDQYEQLKRYQEYAEREKCNYHIYYLTKYGTIASNSSHKGIVTYETISYRESIVDWIELCIKEVALIPSIREGLLHYLNLIKKITGISISKEAALEVEDLLLESTEHMNAATKIYDTINNVNFVIKAHQRFWNDLIKVFAVKNYLAVKDENLDSTVIKHIKSKSSQPDKRPRNFGINILLNNPILGNDIKISCRIEVAIEYLHVGFCLYEKSTKRKMNYDSSDIYFSHTNVCNDIRSITKTLKHADNGNICNDRWSSDVSFSPEKFKDTYLRKKLYDTKNICAIADHALCFIKLVENLEFSLTSD